MEVGAERVRERYAALPTEELTRIVEAPEGTYTAEAKAVARGILAVRRLHPIVETAPEPTPSYVRKRQTWALAIFVLVVGHVGESIFSAFRGVEKHPDVLNQILSYLVHSVWTYVLVAVVGVYFWKAQSS